MSLIARKRSERVMTPFGDWGKGGGNTVTTTEQALRLVPVFAATGLISDMIAAAPWGVFRKSSGVPSRVSKPPQLFTDPDLHLDVLGWKFQAMTSLLLRGNAYGLIVDLDGAGVPSKVKWLNPSNVTVDEQGPRPVFSYNGRPIATDAVIHIPGYVLPGSVVGLSPLGLFRRQLETGMSAQEFGDRFFDRDGITPGGHFKNTAKNLSADVADSIKARFKLAVKNHDVLVTGQDWEYLPITVAPADAAFAAGIRITANQVAAIYRVAPEIVGGESGGSTLTYKSLEQDAIRFNQITLRPWTSRLEAALSVYLPANQYLKTNLDAGARADLKTRYESHKIAIDAGFSTIDEVRALEEKAPLTTVERALYLEQLAKTPKPAVGP